MHAADVFRPQERSSGYGFILRKAKTDWFRQLSKNQIRDSPKEKEHDYLAADVGLLRTSVAV